MAPGGLKSCCCDWHLLPLSLTFFIACGPLICITLALSFDPHYGLFPTISSVIKKPPESAVSILTGAVSLYLGIVTWALRLKQIQLLHSRLPCIRHATRAIVVLGTIASIGLLLLLGFQSVRPVGNVHNCAAVSAFVGLAAMHTVHTGVTWRLTCALRRQRVCLVLQVVLTLLTWCFGTMCALGFQFWGSNQTWKRLGSLGEWLTYYTIALYSLTMMGEFRWHRVHLDIRTHCTCTIVA